MPGFVAGKAQVAVGEGTRRTDGARDGAVIVDPFVARAFGGKREQRLQGRVGDQSPAPVARSSSPPSVPAGSPPTGAYPSMMGWTGRTGASLRMYSCRFIASPSIDLLVACPRENQTGIHRTLTEGTPRPLPHGPPPSPALRFMPGQSPAGGVRNAGRWPGFGARCGVRRNGSTAPADEHPGHAPANAPGGPARRYRGRTRPGRVAFPAVR